MYDAFGGNSSFLLSCLFQIVQGVWCGSQPGHPAQVAMGADALEIPKTPATKARHADMCGRNLPHLRKTAGFPLSFHRGGGTCGGGIGLWPVSVSEMN